MERTTLARDADTSGMAQSAATTAGASNSPEHHGTIDRTSPIPLYYQLYRLLLDKIERGDWKPGDIISSETELGERYAVSRITTRQALQLLVMDGYLYRQQGKGTFVTKPKIQHGPEGAFGLTGYLRAHGYRAGWRLLSMERVIPPKSAKENLCTAHDEPVLEIRRLRLADDNVIGLHRAFVPYPLAHQVREEYLTQGESTLHYMEECMNLPLRESNRTIGSIPAAEEEAAALQVESGFPLLLIRRTTMGADGRPVEYLRAVYRGDRFEYHLHLEHSARTRHPGHQF